MIYIYKLLKKLNALLLMLAIGSGVLAQTNFTAPKNHVYDGLNNYTAFLAKTAGANAGLLNKKFQKDYTKIITEKNTDLVKNIKDNGFLFDADVYPYLNAIFNHILQKNNLDKNQFHFFVDRSATVNAYSYEDGTIACNLGLLNIMENESQLAMVFCHELGHYLLKHVNNSIVMSLEHYNSPEFIAQVKKIKKQEYNVNKQLEDLYTDEVFNHRRHNRGQERAADSLGIVLFMQTGYDGTNVSRVFDLLAAAEDAPNAGVLKGFFSAEHIAVEDSWLKPARKMTFGTIKKEIVDSLKTHPDCALRKVSMQAWFDKNPKKGTDFLIGNSQKLADIKKTAVFDASSYSRERDNLAYYLFQLMQANTAYPANAFVKTEIFNTWLSLCNHQQRHTLHTVVPTQYQGDDNDEYAILLKLLDTIDLDQMTAITTAYYQNNKTYITASADALNNLKLLKN